MNSINNSSEVLKAAALQPALQVAASQPASASQPAFDSYNDDSDDGWCEVRDWGGGFCNCKNCLMAMNDPTLGDFSSDENDDDE